MLLRVPPTRSILEWLAGVCRPFDRPLVPGRLGTTVPGLTCGQAAPCPTHGSRRRTLGGGGQSPRVDASPPPPAQEGWVGGHAGFTAQRPRAAPLPRFPRPQSGQPVAPSGGLGAQCHPFSPWQERELEAVTPHFKGPPIN